MNFYRLYLSFDPKVTGVFPQVQNLNFPTTWDSPKALGSLYFQKASREVEIPKANLHSRAKQTDLMSVSHFANLLLSSKLKILFEKHKIYGIEFLETTLKVKNIEKIGFWFSNLYQLGYKFLDLEQSTFNIVTDVLKMIPLKEVNFHNDKEVEEYYKKDRQDVLNKGMVHHPLVITKVVIKPDADIDFFALRTVLNGGIGYYVSENLKTEIEKEGCTGIVFRKLNEPFP